MSVAYGFCAFTVRMCSTVITVSTPFSSAHRLRRQRTIIASLRIVIAILLSAAAAAAARRFHLLPRKDKWLMRPDLSHIVHSILWFYRLFAGKACYAQHERSPNLTSPRIATRAADDAVHPDLLSLDGLFRTMAKPITVVFFKPLWSILLLVAAETPHD